MAEKDQSYSLGKSEKRLGQLYPILKDAHGNIIDGFNRQNDNPDWRIETVETIDTPQKLELARLATNFCRRNVPDTEIQNRITFLIGKCGMKPEEIAEETGISVSTIYKHMPQELKNQKRSETTKEGIKKAKQPPSLEVNSKTQDIPVRSNGFVECEIGMHLVDPSRVRNVHGHVVCNGHEEVAKSRFKPKPEPEAKESKPEETWEQRKAVRSPQKSKIELKIVEGLRLKGYKVTSDVSIVVKQIVTVPDFNIELENGKVIHCYIDGVVHLGKKRDKDEELRALLKQVEPNCLIVPVDVKGDSDAEASVKIKEIEEAMKW